MAVLVTGGAGYIGSHTCVELLNSGYEVVVMDNLYNSNEKALERVEKITGKPVKFYCVDMLDKDAMNDIFEKEDIDSVIHFAGYKAVGESVQKPLEYYHNNITGTLNLCDVTLIRSEHIKRASSARIPKESLTILFLILRRWLWENWKSLVCSAMTTIHRTVQVCVTTYMWWIWQEAM